MNINDIGLSVERMELLRLIIKLYNPQKIWIINNLTTA